MRKMNVFVAIALVVVMALVLAACAAGGEEPAAANPAPTNTPEPALDTVTPAGEGAPAVDGTDERTVEASGGAFTGTKIVTDTVSPVVVDLGAITPGAADAGDGKLQEMPAPGVPHPEVKLAQQAKMDLAQRLDVDVSAINVVKNEAVEWPSSALGCPEEGMAYLTVITPGYKIVLEASGEQYTYHTDQNENAVLCGADGHPVK